MTLIASPFSDKILLLVDLDLKNKQPLKILQNTLTGNTNL